MVTVTKTKLIIVLEPEHPPSDVLFDLQQSILRALQNQGDNLEKEQQKDVNVCLLYLLEEMLYVKGEGKK